MHPTRLVRTPWPAFVVSIAALLAASTGLATATSNSNDTISACANKKTGELRAIRVSEHCTTKESLLTWNVQGPKELPARSVPGGQRVRPARRVNPVPLVNPVPEVNPVPPVNPVRRVRRA